ncbi:hypothetical protein B0T17DRAFT_234002 [Bombardia bombarda]|uniref:Uncharacterized protein n=1 Tax=Bombardia bombarda TaxID=252184 RepID=A0AA39XBH7_9PEZI|nr:hypothetical protein B0T17DRAFT_234002 [Bombardia bombarda]
MYHQIDPYESSDQMDDFIVVTSRLTPPTSQSSEDSYSNGHGRPVSQHTDSDQDDYYEEEDYEKEEPVCSSFSSLSSSTFAGFKPSLSKERDDTKVSVKVGGEREDQSQASENEDVVSVRSSSPLLSTPILSTSGSSQTQERAAVPTIETPLAAPDNDVDAATELESEPEYPEISTVLNYTNALLKLERELAEVFSKLDEEERELRELDLERKKAERERAWEAILLKVGTSCRWGLVSLFFEGLKYGLFAERLRQTNPVGQMEEALKDIEERKNKTVQHYEHMRERLNAFHLENARKERQAYLVRHLNE